jgi:hypothetical protein
VGTSATKEAIIGQYINGRNATDDFLQLADNHGGTVFGWIDADGHLQGSLLFGTTSTLTAGEVGFGSVTNTITGDPSFTFSTIIGLSVPNLISNSNVTANGGFGSAAINGSPALFVNGSTAATNIANVSSGKITLTGKYWDSAASQDDTWTVKSVLATGTNPASTLSITHAGSPGSNYVSAPALSVTGSGLTATVPVTITQLGTGPTNATTTALFLTDGVTPGAGVYFSTTGNTFRIRMDADIVNAHGNLQWGSTGMNVDGGSNSPVLLLYTGAPAGGYTGITNNSAQIDFNSTGLLALTENPGLGGHGEILLSPVDDTITFYGHTSGNAAIGTALAAGTPNKINLPITTAASSGMFLISDGGSPQQTSWTNVMPFVSPPANAGSSGTQGQIAFDATHMYVCISTNTWIRAVFAGGF